MFEDGTEKPISYASRTLSPSERNNAQIEREDVSLIFGVRKFHDFLYGRKFTLVTDHKSLLAILGPKSGVPTLAAARMQRWELIVSAHYYDIEYRSSSSHANCDALSRLPNPQNTGEGAGSPVYTVNTVDERFPVLSEKIARQTRLRSGA